MYKRKYSTKNIAKFRNELTSEKLDDVLKIPDPQQAMTHLHQILCRAHNTSFPIEKHKLNYSNRKPWLSNSLKKSIRKKKYNVYITAKKNYHRKTGFI